MVGNTPLDRRAQETIEHLCWRWKHANRTVLRRVFPLLSRGRALPLSVIAEAAGVSRQVIEDILVAGRAGRDTEGRVTELFGVTLDPTLHRVEIDGVCLFTCCAAVAQMVPSLIEKKARIESVDPVSRLIVRLQVDPEGVPLWDPPEAHACFVETHLDQVMSDVGAAFCSHVRHFASRESAQQFVEADPVRYLLSIHDLHTVAVQLYRRIWG
ncbi:MAG: hypothetical protein GTO22_19110 [Gemmatimonadales bacterium]|nr:hypothetical protein [Gemmatimonadales bacterium]